jgi:hypothetical protein
MLRVTSVRFTRFKGLKDFSVSLDQFNILVGPNNAGKSTVLGAFRILAEAMRRARTKNATLVVGPDGNAKGYEVNLSNVPIATENVFYNYEEDLGAKVVFHVSSGNTLTLFFPEAGVCNLICEAGGRPVVTASTFRQHFDFRIGFVPVLGPVEHDEQLYQEEAASDALLTHRASRNFRNIWYHYPEDFGEFRALVRETWPGMDIKPPEVDRSHPKPLLRMFCPEDRFDREIYWAGFGFQVWCQMLTFMVKNANASLFIIDEPDIYLHSDLQRQLVAILRSLGPDILIATHSTEIISEADPNEILLVTKKARSAQRITDPSRLQAVFDVLGSNLNPTLTQMARSRRVVYVEGKDFLLLSRFANKLNMRAVAIRSSFAVVPTEGFNPSKVAIFTQGVEATLSTSVLAAVVFDRDYRSDEEIASEQAALLEHCSYAHIHARKELENFVLVPSAIDRAIARRVAEKTARTGEQVVCAETAADMMQSITEEMKPAVQAQYLEKRRPFLKQVQPGVDDATLTQRILGDFEADWADLDRRLTVVPGKEVLSRMNTHLQATCGLTVTANSIIEAMRVDEVPSEMVEVIEELDQFAKRVVDRV